MPGGVNRRRLPFCSFSCCLRCADGGWPLDDSTGTSTKEGVLFPFGAQAPFRSTRVRYSSLVANPIMGVVKGQAANSCNTVMMGAKKCFCCEVRWAWKSLLLEVE